MERVPKIGEVYLMKFEGSGSAQTGWRPGLVFQNNVGNSHSPNIIALPLTSAIKRTSMPTHVVISAADSGLRVDSMVLCENPQRMQKNNIGAFLTEVSDEYMKKIAVASLLASSAISFLDIDTLTETWKRAVRLNSERVA